MEQSTDGKWLAVPLDSDVILFECPQGAYARTLKGSVGRVIAVTFSPDGRLLASIVRAEPALHGIVHVWELDSGRKLFTKRQPGSQVFGGVVFSPDSRRLITEDDERVRVLDARSGEEVQTVEVRPGGIHSMCFSPDGRHFALAVFNDKSARIVDWHNGKLGTALTLVGDRGPVAVVAYSPDGRYLATGEIQAFKLWDATTLKAIRTVDAPAERLTFAPDSQTLFAATTTATQKTVHTLRRWSVPDLRELPALSLTTSAEPMHGYYCLSRDGNALFAGPRWNMGRVHVIDAGTGKDLLPQSGHSAPLNAVAVNADGRTLASAGEDRAIKVWDLASGQEIFTLSAHADAVTGLTFSPDGALLASAGRDGVVALWDADEGKLLRTFPGHARAMSQLAISPNGAILAAGGESGCARVWTVATGKEGAPLVGHAGAVRCVTFSPDGKFLASGGEDKTVRLHDLVKGESHQFLRQTPSTRWRFPRTGARWPPLPTVPKPPCVSGTSKPAWGRRGQATPVKFMAWPFPRRQMCWRRVERKAPCVCGTCRAASRADARWVLGHWPDLSGRSRSRPTGAT